MREAINENRTVQLALVAVLVLLGGLFLMKTMKKGGSSTPAPVVSTTGTTDPATGAAATTTDPTAATTDPAAVSGTSATTLTTASPVPAAMVPGPGLPKDLLVSYGRGKTIVLLLVRAGGIDDRLLRASVDRLRSEPGLALYVAKAKDISRYAWLTQGVNVTQVPALVVLQPRELSGDTPTATVSYGFRGPGSVVQAVRDALYKGPAVTYHP